MNSPSSRLALPLALSVLISAAGCATDSARLGIAARAKATADVQSSTIDLAEQERVASRQLPALPAECRKRERSGVKLGERADVALLKTDQALTRANGRVVNCAAWYDKLKDGREKQ